MEFGARQCKPKNPDCHSCPIKDSCVAVQKNLVDTLPVKLKKTKITTKYFNYLVCIDDDKNILFEKRDKKGIWQNLYQFPLVESDKSLNPDEFHLLDLKNTVLNSVNFDYALYNDSDKIHKLSHQHLHTKFWILEVAELPKEAIPVKHLKKYPAPVLISDFINEFNFSNL
jgi:A/G-specific adenine glycosylase